MDEFDKALEDREQVYNYLKSTGRFKRNVDKIRDQIPQYRTSLLSCLLFGCDHSELFELTTSLGRVLYLYLSAEELPFVLAYDFLFYDKLLKNKHQTRKLYRQLTKYKDTKIELSSLTTLAFEAAYLLFVKSIYSEYKENGTARPARLRELVDELRSAAEKALG